jgi:hypothetical protein
LLMRIASKVPGSASARSATSGSIAANRNMDNPSSLSGILGGKFAWGIQVWVRGER